MSEDYKIVEIPLIYLSREDLEVYAPEDEHMSDEDFQTVADIMKENMDHSFSEEVLDAIETMKLEKEQEKKEHPA